MTFKTCSNFCLPNHVQTGLRGSLLGLRNSKKNVVLNQVNMVAYYSAKRCIMAVQNLKLCAHHSNFDIWPIFCNFFSFCLILSTILVRLVCCFSYGYPDPSLTCSYYKVHRVLIIRKDGFTDKKIMFLALPYFQKIVRTILELFQWAVAFQYSMKMASTTYETLFKNG